MGPNTGFESAMQSLRPSDQVTLLLESGLVSPLLSPQLVGPFDNAEQVVVTFFTLLLLVIGSLFLYYAVKEFYRTLGLALSRPITAAEVASASGAVELEGTAQPLDDSDDGETIAYKRERKKKETSRDSDGNKEVNWKTISSSEGASPFRLADETGSVAVDPDGANLSIDMDLTNSTSRRRTYRGSITPDDTVHIYGQKQSADDVEDPPGDAAFFVGDGDGKFLISDTTQFRTVVRYLFSGIKYFVFALVALGFALVVGLVTLDMLFGFNPFGI